MPSIGEQIIAAQIVALNTGTPSDVPNTQRERINPTAPGNLPAMSVRPVNDVPERVGGNRGPLVQRVLTIEYEIWSEGNSLIVDPILVWLTATLVDNTLTGLATQVHEGETDWEASELDRDYIKATLQIEVTYQTMAANRESIGS